MKPLTPEQIENWRKAMIPLFGAYALLMPVEQIEAIRTAMQNKLTPSPNSESVKDDLL
jgi:hypothetical protein